MERARVRPVVQGTNGARPRITVVLPVRNEGSRVTACLRALHAQDHPSFEILAVDGHSSDDTREILERAGVRVILDGRVSAAEARNRGILAARGDIVAFIDGDCIPSPGWLSALARHFDDPSVGGAGGAIRVGDRSNVWSIVEDVDSSLFYRGFITSNVAYRRQALLEVGGFDPSLRCGEDWECWWRVRDAGYAVVYDPDAVVTHMPTELDGLRAHLRKQMWYAREDMRCYRRRLEVMVDRLSRGEPFVIEEPWRIMRTSLVYMTFAAGLAAAPVSKKAAFAAALAFAVWASGRLRRAVPDMVSAERLPGYVAMLTVKAAVRGAGAWLGVMDAVVDRARGREGAPLPGPRPPEADAPRARLHPVAPHP